MSDPIVLLIESGICGHMLREVERAVESGTDRLAMLEMTCDQCGYDVTLRLSDYVEEDD